MKHLGIIRNIDDLGRIVVPKEMRTALRINNSDPVEITVEGDKIVIKKFEESCVFCSETEGLVEFKDKKLCKACLEEIKA